MLTKSVRSYNTFEKAVYRTKRALLSAVRETFPKFADVDEVAIDDLTAYIES